jgi:hypothetical protein
MTDQGMTVRRRGILAAAGAVVAGLVTRQASVPVAAAIVSLQYKNVDDGTSVGNTPARTVYLTTSGALGVDITQTVFEVASDVSGIDALTGDASGRASLTNSGRNGVVGIGGQGQGAGVVGIARSAFSFGTDTGAGGGNGVYGLANAGGVSGVYGQNNAANGFGIAGRCDESGGVGALGSSLGGIGVLGNVANGSTATNTVGLKGTNSSTGAGGIGVQGTADHGLGGSFQGELAPLRLVPGGLASPALTTLGHQAGELYVTSDNLLYFFDGTAWKQIFFGAPAAFVPPPSGSPPTRGTPPPVSGPANAGTQEVRATITGQPAPPARP